MQLYAKKINNSIKEWAEDLNRHLPLSETYRWPKKYMKGCSTLVIIREMLIKTTVRYHLTLVRITIIKKSIKIKYLRGYGGKGSPPTLLVGMQSGPATMENNMEVP